ncbi:hypothetical protein E2C01_017031 [Portunus trituberculatus]|uniref:Uncharacterized protein n=1 Tax=Portunus trituberculatus TaxID=210409 RepID=A0A5B7DQK5_PORTR|nr:hypothetical protein [Portunus trituberculatus]
MSSLMDKQGRLTTETTELRLRLVECEKVQDSTQKLDKEVKEVISLGRFSEGGRRPTKVENEIAGGGGENYDKEREAGR